MIYGTPLSPWGIFMSGMALTYNHDGWRSSRALRTCTSGSLELLETQAISMVRNRRVRGKGANIGNISLAILPFDERVLIPDDDPYGISQNKSHLHLTAHGHTNLLAARYQALDHLVRLLLPEALLSFIDNNSPSFDHGRLDEAFVHPEDHK
jgi:hypothetical protein